MCKASLWAVHHTIARVGETHSIGTSSHGLPALHPQGQDPKSCIVCVPDRTVLTLQNIPIELQKRYNVGSSATGMFRDTGDDQHDMLDIAGQRAYLSEFANKGVTAFVGAVAIAGDDGGTVLRKPENITA
jgi:hypothetical protein